MICRLFTTYYREPKPFRRTELDLCLALNRHAFDEIRVLSEGVPGDGWRVLNRRQTYDDAIQWAMELAGPNDVSVIANCDILIPRGSHEQIANTIGPEEFYCLTRYEVGPGGVPKLYNTNASQDVWAFRGKPKAVTHPDFFGVPGCENRFAYRLRDAGYRVLNPSRSIQTIHVHNSMIRTQMNSVKHRLPAPYLFIKPHHLGEEPEYRAIESSDELRAEIVRSREARKLERMMT